ncbi:hypothetical protein Tco_0553702 [Tanacetum coccineum]
MTRQRLHTDSEICMYALTVSTIKPKNIKTIGSVVKLHNCKRMTDEVGGAHDKSIEHIDEFSRVNTPTHEIFLWQICFLGRHTVDTAKYVIEEGLCARSMGNGFAVFEFSVEMGLIMCDCSSGESGCKMFSRQSDDGVYSARMMSLGYQLRGTISLCDKWDLLGLGGILCMLLVWRSGGQDVVMVIEDLRVWRRTAANIVYWSLHVVRTEADNVDEALSNGVFWVITRALEMSSERVNYVSLVL